jgi:hypothetical protein
MPVGGLVDRLRSKRALIAGGVVARKMELSGLYTILH